MSKLKQDNPLPISAFPRNLILAGQDAKLALSGWRIWATMAWNDIAQRYRRSVIGPFWLTLSTAIFVGGLGLLYASLLHQNIKTYLPYLATGYVFWGMISSFLVESAYCFTSSEGYLKQMRISKIGLVLRMVLRNFIIFLHNIVVIAVVMIWFAVTPGPSFALIIPALLINLWFGAAIALLLGMICTRFRDINQFVTSLISILLFCTPIFWNASTASPALQTVAYVNPIAAFIAIFRDPLLGLPIRAYDWEMAGGSTLVVTALAALFFIRFRSRILYWL
jgi:ABC-type polysaccharide/polyol phosphate export permease